MGNKKIHILVKTDTKQKLNSIRAELETDLVTNRVSYDEIINLLLDNFKANNKPTKSKKTKVG